MHHPALNEVETNSLSVAILARSEVLRRGIEAVLRSLPTFDLFRECTGPAEAVTLLQSEKFDVVIVSAADAAWLETARQPLVNAGTTVLVLVDESAIVDPSGYASLPVDGFLSQQHLSAETIRDALQRCRRGELPIPPDLGRALLARANGPARRQWNGMSDLTTRESEALSLLVSGLSNKQIARRLAISTHGAKRLVASIMLKLGSPNRTSAAVLAVKAGIVNSHEATG